MAFPTTFPQLQGEPQKYRVYLHPLALVLQKERDRKCVFLSDLGQMCSKIEMGTIYSTSVTWAMVTLHTGSPELAACPPGGLKGRILG